MKDLLELLIQIKIIIFYFLLRLTLNQIMKFQSCDFVLSDEHGKKNLVACFSSENLVTIELKNRLQRFNKIDGQLGYGYHRYAKSPAIY